MVGARRVLEPFERGGSVARDAAAVEQVLPVDGLRLDDAVLRGRRDPCGRPLGRARENPGEILARRRRERLQRYRAPHVNSAR